MLIFSVLNWAFDIAMLFFLFRKVEKNTNVTIENQILTVLSFIMMFPLYLAIPAISNILLRCVFRIATLAIWIYAYKGFSLLSSIYWGSFAWLVFSCSNIIFLTPPLVGLKRDLAMMLESQLQVVLLGRIAEYILEFIIMLIFSSTIHFNTTGVIAIERPLIIATLIICNLYIKSSLHSLANSPDTAYPIELTVYPILMQLLVLILPISLERYIYLREQAELSRRMESMKQRMYEHSLAQQQADLEVRQLHHDMKNHLLAISSMLNKDDEKAEKYIEQFIEKIAPYEMHANTGNKVLDGLLSEKIHLSKSYGIEINADIDFSKGKFIDDMDVCTIFGNALDNAIEASKNVKNAEKRFIQIKCNNAPGQLIIRVSNYFEGSLKDGKKFLESTKGSIGHGIGMSSMDSVMKKLNGEMVYYVDEYHNFILTFMIPIPN